jgi:cytochrome P450
MGAKSSEMRLVILLTLLCFHSILSFFPFSSSTVGYYADCNPSAQIFGLTLAGSHTTSAALGWIIKFLAENQDVQSRLRSEIRTAYGQAVEKGREPTFEELSQRRHPYIEAVVEEALRCH